VYLFEQMEMTNNGYEAVVDSSGLLFSDAAGIKENPSYVFQADFLARNVRITDMAESKSQTILFDDIPALIHPDDMASVRSVLSIRTDNERRRIRMKVRAIKDGDTRCFDVKGVMDSCDNRIVCTGYAFDARFSDDQKQCMAYFESHDALTGLANAAAFDRFVKDFFKYGMYPQTLIVAKIDRFNEINNAFGYSAGNMLIKNIAEVIKECFFDAEMIARIGGGEFCVVYAGKSQTELDNKLKQTRMMLHGMYMNLVKADVIFGYSTAEKAESFCDIYRQALGKMRRTAAINAVLSQHTVIDSLIAIIEDKAAWGKRHVRLQSLSAQVAAVLGCGEECIDVVKVLAKIADIGFIGLDDSLIKNRLSLSDDEYNEFMQHVEFGRKIIAEVDDLKDMQELYIGVFKRYDEHSDSIPLPSRIVAGVRGFDDLVTMRGCGGREITEPFMRTRGREFCPDVVEAIVDVACRHYALR